VNDKCGGQTPPGRRDGFTRRQMAMFGDDFFALLENRRAAGAMYGAVDAASAQQRGIAALTMASVACRVMSPCTKMSVPSPRSILWKSCIEKRVSKFQSPASCEWMTARLAQVKT